MNTNTRSKLIVALSFLVDIAILYFSIKYSAAIVSGFQIEVNIKIEHMAVFCGFSLFYLIMFDSYSIKAENVYNALLSVGLSVLATVVSVFLISMIFHWKYTSFLFWIVFLFIFEVTLLVWRTIIAFSKKKIGEKRKFLIVENMHNTSRLARKLKYASNEENQAWYHMLDETNDAEVEKLINDEIEHFDAVFISPSISSSVSSRIMFKALMLDKDVNILADVYGVTTLKGKIYQIDDTPVIQKKSIHLSKMQTFVKRIFDIFFALVLSIITSPLFLICAIAIKIDSKGPIIYKQERYTLHKKVFNVYKFRTMVADAEKNGAQFAIESDPRITRTGKILRALRFDELPQIYNILFGTMSVVGPRPERPVFADEFSRNVANYDMRYCLKAGLTGYAQVYGRYNTRVSDKILMDMMYGTTYSFMLDIKLILLTIKIMFMKSATAGIDDELDDALSSLELEDKRRDATVKIMGEYNEKNFDNHTRI